MKSGQQMPVKSCLDSIVQEKEKIFLNKAARHKDKSQLRAHIYAYRNHSLRYSQARSSAWTFVIATFGSESSFTYEKRQGSIVDDDKSGLTSTMKTKPKYPIG